jgi:hypothetical protein
VIDDGNLKGVEGIEKTGSLEAIAISYGANG